MRHETFDWLVLRSEHLNEYMNYIYSEYYPAIWVNHFWRVDVSEVPLDSPCNGRNGKVIYMLRWLWSMEFFWFFIWEEKSYGGTDHPDWDLNSTRGSLIFFIIGHNLFYFRLYQ